MGEPARQFTDHRLTAVEPAEPDPDLGAGSAPTAYDELLEQLKTPTAKPELTLPIPERPGWSARYSTSMIDDDLARWDRIAGQRDRLDDSPERGRFTHRLLGAALVLAEKCTAILHDGEPVKIGDDVTVRFGERAYLESLGTKRSVVAVRIVYDNDADVITTAERIMDAAGYGPGRIRDDDEDRSDPT
jgi:hypothetical protein